MPEYLYSAVERTSGNEHSGRVTASSREGAIRELKARGLLPTDVSLASATVVEPPGAVGRRSKRRRRSRAVPAHAVVTFTRQLATMVRARLPLLRALEVLARQPGSVAFREVLQGAAEAIRSGGTLSDALAQHPRVFEPLYVNMVRAGEASGALDVVLERLSRYLEKRAKLRARVRAALAYPVVILVVAMGIVSALVVFVVPRFESVFAGLLKGEPLPWLTQVVVSGSRLVQEQLALVGAALVVGSLLLSWASRSPRGQRLIETALGHLPGLGDLLLKAATARFTRTWGTLLVSGVPILDALRITRDTSGHVRVGEALGRVHDHVQAGGAVARALEEARSFPPMLTSMVAVGEETGELAEMLSRVADAYEDEVDQAVAALTSLLEPLMIVLMAVIVGTIVVALFLPIVRIVQLLS